MPSDTLAAAGVTAPVGGAVRAGWAWAALVVLADSDIWGLITYNYNKYVLACPISTLAARLQGLYLLFQ